MRPKVTALVPVVTLCICCGIALSAGGVTGQGRFEKIAGNPAAGYQTLYEWDLFLSPPDNGFIGPCRRLGAPPGQTPTGDGYYRIDALPAGNYSILVNQPDFFASPKVIPDVQSVDGQVKTLNIDLDVDYSTYYRIDNKWTAWLAPWYQTFRATGDGVRGVSWKMAGWNAYGGQRAEISILEDNGDPDVRNWKVIGSGEDNQLNAESDEWVRWTSGQIPLTPGKVYAVKVWVSGGCAIFYRDKDASSYAHGRAYDVNGNPQNFDLNITVFVDKHDQVVTHTKHFPKLRGLQSGHFAKRWGQSFVATGTSLAAVDVFAAGQDVPGIDVLHLTFTIHEDGPGGRQIGPTKRTYGAYFAAATDLLGVSYNPGDIPLAPGRTYYVDFTHPEGFTPHTQEAWDRYADGQAYKNGAAVDEDLAMTIIEYTHPIYRPAGFAGYWNFDEGSGMVAGDSSGQENGGLIMNADASIRGEGRYGGALHFDGVDDYVRITDYKGITGDQPRTCAAWIKTDAPGGDIVGWGKLSRGARCNFCIDASGRLRLEFGGGAAVGTVSVADGQWRHAAVTFASEADVRFYVDGKADGVSINGLPQANTAAAADVTLGGYPDAQRYFRAALDEVVLFDLALSEAQIRQLYTAPAATFLRPCGDATLASMFRRPADINKDCLVDLADAAVLAADWLAGGVLAGDIAYDETVDLADAAVLAGDYLLSVTPGLMVHLPFDESSGGVARDASLNGFAAALTNMDDTAWVEGRSGNALAFDGENDSVVISGYKGIGGSLPRSICAWVKTAQPGGTIVSWGTAGHPGGRCVLLTSPSGCPQLAVGAGFSVASTSVCDDQWHHIAAVFDNDGSPDVEDVRFYVDGQLDTPASVAPRVMNTVIDDAASRDVTVGTFDSLAAFYGGLIDDVRIYSLALTAEQILDLAR